MPTLPNTDALLIGIADYRQVTRLPQQVRNEVQVIDAVLVDPQRLIWLQGAGGCALRWGNSFRP